NAFDHRPLETNLSTSLSFFQSSPQVLPLLRQFRTQQSSLFEELAKVKACFNPLAALKNHEHEAEKLAHSKLALEREKLIPKQPIPSVPHHRQPPNPSQVAQAFKGFAGDLAREALWILHR